MEGLAVDQIVSCMNTNQTRMRNVLQAGRLHGDPVDGTSQIAWCEKTPSTPEVQVSMNDLKLVKLLYLLKIGMSYRSIDGRDRDRYKNRFFRQAPACHSTRDSEQHTIKL